MFAVAVLEVAACSAILAAGGGLSLGVVWYVSSVLPEAKRTLINRLISYQCLVATLLNATSSGMLILTKAVGGAHPLYCSAVMFLARSFTWSCLLAADTVAVLKYLFTCRANKNNAALSCNDDLLYKAVIVVIGVVPLYFASLMEFSGVDFTTTYYICVGQTKGRKGE